MKGGSLNLPTRTPLITPTARQQTMAARMAMMAATPLLIMVAEIMADMATTEPMDRSMLPVIRITPWPTPTSRYLAMERSRFSMLLVVKMFGSMRPKTTYRMIQPAKPTSAAPMPRMEVNFRLFSFSVLIISAPP